MEWADQTQQQTLLTLHRNPSSVAPATMLKGWSGFLRTDGYSCLPNKRPQAHPQFVLQHRIEEARRLANRKRDDRKRRRACNPVPGQLADVNQPVEPSPAATE